MDEKKSNTLSILTLIFGIIGLFLSFVASGTLLCIVSLVLGIIALCKKQSKGMSIAGIACSAIGLFVTIIMVAVSLMITGSSDSDTVESGSETAKASISGTEYIPPEEAEEVETDWATAFTPISDFRYTIDGNTITLVRYEGDDTQILLSPTYTLNGTDYTLISMGDDACFLSEGYITSVIIPEGVEEIGASCFNSCASLKRIYLPSTLKEIPSAFFTYFDDYTVFCNSTIDMPSERDMSEYELATDDMTGSGELGEGFARAINGMMYGADNADSEDAPVEIYFGGTDEQWSALTE